jgi:anaerobic selenocysteine-containing dehydrogenase
MTNHWNDIDNTSLVLVYGANPAENHPACMAHINAARFGKKNARLIVVDPRLTRTARQCDPARGDFYVRIRPGTNVAFTNGMLKWIFDNIATYDATASANMLAWHNNTSSASASLGRTMVDDSGATRTLDASQLTLASYDGTTHPLAGGYPKYADTRFIVNAAGNDYQRGTLTLGTAGVLSSFPVIAPTVDSQVGGLNTVWTSLKAHVAPYDLATVADICGCSQADISNVAKALIDHSRFNSSDFTAAGTATPQASGYKATTILYAMGQTQHTNGSQNIKDLAIIQTLMGNMGRPGGGINALRGIHNVQGSTDIGLLFDSIPGYSGNPAATDHYTHYSNTLFGNRVEGTGAKDWRTASNLGLQQRGFHNMTQEWFGTGLLDSSTGTSPHTNIEKLYRLWPKGNGVQHIQTFRYMTKLDADPDKIRAAVCWGQNPAVTEPNQSKVRAGLKELDLLVVVDMYETETASVDRKSIVTGGNRDGVTYLIPACSHAEEAGSVTNSGRWLQWRERATAPKGNSKADLELLLRFAYSLDKAGAFAHMTNVKYSDPTTTVPTRGVWSEVTPPIQGPAYWVLYGNKFGWTPTDPTKFEDLSTTTEMWAAGASAPADRVVMGSEVVAENVYKEICRPLGDTTTSGGTMWIYSGAAPAGGYSTSLTNYNPVCKNADGTAVSWAVRNKAKSRNHTYTGASTGVAGTADTAVANANANNFPRWGWAWLLNRRVFYNNGEIAADQSDNFVSPGLVSCLFTMNSSGTALADWSLAYRKYKTFADAPSVATGPHFLSAGKTFFGRFPGHTEPYESPREDVVAKFGHNMSGTSRLIVEGADGSAIGVVANYPLVLTSIRCVEHFQGGPITRNNSWNVEAEPVPWIEINSVDARRYGIADGDWVDVITARSNSRSDQEGRSPNSASGWAKGFKARVGVGLASNQRVAEGVVAIPWHWGDKGLGTGSRANDLCIDAWDANTMIPEYKACLCKIKKMS